MTMLPMDLPPSIDNAVPVTIQLAANQQLPERAIGVCELTVPVKDNNGTFLSLTKEQLQSGIKPYASSGLFPSIEAHKFFLNDPNDMTGGKTGTGFDVVVPDNLSISMVKKPQHGKLMYGPTHRFKVTDKERNDSDALSQLEYIPSPGYIGKDTAIFAITNPAGEKIAVKYFFDVNPRNIDLPSEPAGGKYQKYCPEGTRIWKIFPFHGEKQVGQMYGLLPPSGLPVTPKR